MLYWTTYHGLIRMSVGLCMLGRGKGEGNTPAVRDGVHAPHHSDEPSAISVLYIFLASLEYTVENDCSSSRPVYFWPYKSNSRQPTCPKTPSQEWDQILLLHPTIAPTTSPYPPTPSFLPYSNQNTRPLFVEPEPIMRGGKGGGAESFRAAGTRSDTRWKAMEDNGRRWAGMRDA